MQKIETVFELSDVASVAWRPLSDIVGGIVNEILETRSPAAAAITPPNELPQAA